jgi:hypothetical protein
MVYHRAYPKPCKNIMKRCFLIFCGIILFGIYSCREQRKNQHSISNTNKSNVEIEISKNPNVINEQKKSPTDFIPEGFVIHTYEGGIFSEGWNEIKGDLNKDGLEDIVLIIKGTDKSKIIQDEYQGELDRNRRGIIVLLNKGNYYQLASKNYDCFSSENEDGGIYFAPELNVSISKGTLRLEYGHGRYGYRNYAFRYQNGDMELIGYVVHSSRGPVPQYEVSINFSTKKKVIKDNLYKDFDGEDAYPVNYKETWTNFNIEKLVRLSEIKDFDELDMTEYVKL